MDHLRERWLCLYLSMILEFIRTRAAWIFVLVHKLAPVHREGRKGLKKEGNHAQLVGGRIHKPGNLCMRFLLGDHKSGRSLHLLTRIFKVYIQALPGFSPVYHPDGFNTNLLSHGCVPGAASSLGKASGMQIPRTGLGQEPLIAWVQIMGQLGPCYLHDLLQQFST